MNPTVPALLILLLGAPTALVLFKKIQTPWINTLLFLATLAALTGAAITLTPH